MAETGSQFVEMGTKNDKTNLLVDNSSSEQLQTNKNNNVDWDKLNQMNTLK